MRYAIAGATALALLAGPALAQPSDAQVAAFIAAVEQVGCVIENDAQAEAVERTTGFDDATLGEIVGVLLETGRATILPTMEGLRLTTGACG